MPEPKPLTDLPAPSALAHHWRIDPRTVYLNHGSFGAAPTRVLGAQAMWRARMEEELVRFFVEDHESVMDGVRRSLAGFLRCEWDCLALFPNATQAVATVLAHLRDTGFLRAGDEILVPDHEYPACQNNARHFGRLAGASTVAATVPFPLPRDARAAEDAVVAAVMAKCTSRTRVLLLSYVTSPTAIILPVARIISEVRAVSPGVRVIMDAAHGIGYVPGLTPGAAGEDYLTSNCHKWLCAPKGSAFLWVRAGLRDGLRPMVLSNNGEKPRAGRSQFLTEFDYVGTADCTPMYVIPDAMETMGAMVPGGWPQVIERNHALCRKGRDALCNALGIEPAAPDSWNGSTSSLVLPAHEPARMQRLLARPTRYADALQDVLLDKWRIQVPLWNWTLADGRMLRIVRVSAQLYNSEGQYEYLAGALSEELIAEKRN